MPSPPVSRAHSDLSGQHEGVSKAFPISQSPLHFLRSNFAKSALDILGASVVMEEVAAGPRAGPFSA